MIKKNKPTIRFSGFIEDWEQRKLGEEIYIGSGKDYKHLNNGPIPVYGTGGYMLSVDQALSQDDDAIGLGRKGTIDKPYILRAPFWTVDTLFYIIPNKRNSLDFMYCLFQKINWKDKDESTGVPSLSKTTITDVDIIIPANKEQIRLGLFFSNIDTLITLHQRKLEALKKVKRSLLQKMFPSDGEKIPMIRFYGFNEDWEQRKLRELASKAVDNRGKTPPLNENGNYSLIEVASLGNCFPDYTKVEKYLDEYTFKNNLRDYLRKDDILFSTVGSIGLVSLMDENKYAAIAQNIVAFRSLKDISPMFLYSLFSANVNKKKANAICMVAVQPSIKVSQLIDVEYYVTNKVKEQQKVGRLFYSIDNLITLHQRKLDKLNDIKKALLQKMFV